jgi:hypothetical protein
MEWIFWLILMVILWSVFLKSSSNWFLCWPLRSVPGFSSSRIDFFLSFPSLTVSAVAGGSGALVFLYVAQGRCLLCLFPPREFWSGRCFFLRSGEVLCYICRVCYGPRAALWFQPARAAGADRGRFLLLGFSVLALFFFISTRESSFSGPLWFCLLSAVPDSALLASHGAADQISSSDFLLGARFGAEARSFDWPPEAFILPAFCGSCKSSFSWFCRLILGSRIFQLPPVLVLVDLAADGFILVSSLCPALFFFC